MQIIDIINMVSDELRDARETKYSRSSIVYKLKEAMTQFASESKILKKSIAILPSADQSVYDLPRYGDSIADYINYADGDPDPTPSSKFPTYLSLIRLGWRDKIATGENLLLRPNSTFERDEVGSQFNAVGKPLYHYNDNLSFYKFGLWPIPQTEDVVDRVIQIDYVRDVLYYSDSAFQNAISRSEALEDDYLDPDIPEEFLGKIYLLVCYLRLKNSIDPTDVQKAANYKALYEQELLAKALQSGSHMDRYNQLKVQE